MSDFRRKTALFGGIALVLDVALGACQGTADLQASHATREDEQKGPALARFTDIPIPSGATMDVSRSLILGPRDAWIGRLLFQASPGTQETLEFYTREMPAFGWQEITRVRADVSVLTYVRADRAATIQISGTTLGGSSVNFTVSPRAQGTGGMSAGGGSNVRSAPLDRLSR